MKNKVRIGIIGAMDSEIEYLVAQLEEKTVTKFCGYSFYSGGLYDIQVIILKCGVGKVNAARGTQLLIDRFSPNAILNTGIAGAVEPGLRVGDAVIATGFVQHDFDVTAFGYAPGYLCTGVNHDKSTVFLPDKTLSGMLAKAAGQVLDGVNIREGIIATGDIFVADTQRRKYIFSQFGAIAAEMESAAIAQTAYYAAVPIAILRVISDNADGEASVSIDKFEAETAKLSTEIVIEFLKQL
ncbi:MAG: 5'-methylthioadenosine/adenosylhomocysteine nucleosidase [Firmicutes bacterium]|nr:5'-methylthioadenosine/adenosylhomocysteine nucleosidase [Bacillota bacterium]